MVVAYAAVAGSRCGTSRACASTTRSRCGRGCANLEANWDEAVRLTGAGRARVWRLYMAASAVNFEDGRTRSTRCSRCRGEQARSGMPRRPDWDTRSLGASPGGRQLVNGVVARHRDLRCGVAARPTRPLGRRARDPRASPTGSRRCCSRGICSTSGSATSRSACSSPRRCSARPRSRSGPGCGSTGGARSRCCSRRAG